MRILIYLILLLYPFNLISGQKKQKRLSDDELMTLVQKQTFRYFWDFAHPESGLAHERSNGGAETATIGGCSSVGRGFISTPMMRLRMTSLFPSPLSLHIFSRCEISFLSRKKLT